MTLDPALTQALIPGGAHTYSKGSDQFPANAPPWLESGSGGRVRDHQGAEYVDWAMGLRAVILGYGVRPVIEAAIEQMWKGSNFSRPARLETEYAEAFLAAVPGAEMVKFAKNGSTVTTAAVKLARAYTGCDYVAYCRDRTFFSYDDWFIGTTPCNNGVPRAISDLSLPFLYNDLASLEAQFAAHPNRIACVIMEGTTGTPPHGGFLHEVQALARKNGALFILDEMITGFRYDCPGAQSYFGLEPDLSTFGKGIGNGFAVAALVGRREIMDLGGNGHNRRRTFLISTTHGAENHALAAGRAVLTFYRTHPVVETLWATGRTLTAGLLEAAHAAGLSAQFEITGYPCYPDYVCRDAEGRESAAFRTLFQQEMIRHRVIIPYMAPSYGHGAAEIDQTLAAARQAFAVYARALEDGVGRHLEGPAIKPVFRPYN